MKRPSLILLILLVFLIAGCEQEGPTPKPTLSSPEVSSPEADDPESTAIPATEMRETAEPTATPEPTETPQPSPTPISAESLIQTGDTQLLLSDWIGAEEAYRHAIEMEPENATAKARLAYLLQFRPQTVAEAIEIGQEAAELAPDDPVVGAILILALLQVDEFEEAINHAERIDANAFIDPFALSILTDLYLSIGNHDEADRFHEATLRISDMASGIERVQVERVLATHALVNNNRELAFQISIHLAEIAPQFAPAYLYRVQFLTPAGSRGATPRGLVSEGLALDPDYLPLMVESAHLEATAGNFELAMDNCEEIIDRFPEQTDGLLCQGNLLLQQMMYEEALDLFDEIIELDEENYRGHLGRGQANTGLEECETAEVDLMTALEHQPYAVETHIALGKAYECLGLTAEAEAAFEAGQALRPFNPEAHFALAEFYLDNFRYDDAGPQFSRAVVFSPPGSTPEAYYQRLGETIQAVERCSVSGPTIEVTRYLCAGELLMRLEFYLWAAETFNLALALDNDSFYALDGLVGAFANERYCDTSLSFLIRLKSIVQPRNALVDIFESNCETAFSGSTLAPEGELLGEEEAVELIEAAVLDIEGMEEVSISIETIVPGIGEVPAQQVLVVEFDADLEPDSAELHRHLQDNVFAVTEGFVLMDSEPQFMVVQTRVGPDAVPVSYLVPRFSAIHWYNSDMTTGLYFRTWNDFDEVLESLEEESSEETESEE